MTDYLGDSFHQFFNQFKNQASKQNLNFLKQTISKDFAAREIRGDEMVDYAANQSIEG